MSDRCVWVVAAAKAAVMLITVLGASLTSRAQSFSAPVEYFVGSHPYAAVVGDFNGDGKPDLAVANNGSQTVSVLLGNGDTTFSAKTDYVVGANPYGVVVVDLNKDGKLDIIVANSFGLTASVSVLLGNGNGTFQSRVDYAFSGLAQPNSILAADFNSDSNPDLVVVNGSGVTVFLGNGDGTLKTPVGYGSSNFATSVAVADFNGDNKLDLAVTSYGSSSFGGIISIMLGNGDGTFKSPVNFSTGPSPFAVAVGDFNGDSKLDLVTANIQVDSISVLLGNGDGIFQAQVSYPTGPYAYEIAVADFNNDGKLDVLTAGNGSGLSVLKGNGDGTFRAPNNFFTGGVFATVVDLNADGKPDLLTGLQVNSIAVLLNQSGPYSMSGTIRDNNGTAMSGVNVSLTGGAPQLASTSGAGTYIFSDFSAAGNYTITPFRQNYVFAPPNRTFSNLSSNVTADFTGTLLNFSISGRIRDIYGNPMSNLVVALSGTQAAAATTTADGSFSFPILPGGGNYTVTTSYPKFVFSPTSVAVNNLSSNRVINFTGSIATFTISGIVRDVSVNNGSSVDSVPVLLSGSRSGSTLTNSFGYSFTGLPVDGNYTITAFPATGNSLFTNFMLLPPFSQTLDNLSANTTANFSAKRLSFPAGDLVPQGIAQGDLNGDGKLDLAVATQTGNNIQILIGNGDGTFKPHVSYFAAANPEDVVMADFNRDGKLDVASANYYGSNVSIFMGNGDGTLKDRVNYSVTGQAFALVAADFNRDNKLDLAVVGAGSNLNILLGNGDGTFAATITKSVPAGSILTGDFNSDGKPDLVVTSFPDSVLILKGNGDGTFADAVSFPAGSEVRRATVADLNGDGKLDLAVANNRGFTILLGNGDGTFQAPTTNALTVDTVAVRAADFDGDNKLDLAIGNYSGGILLTSGNGDGTFNQPTFYGAGSYTFSLVAGDYNGDGKQDLAISSQFSDDVNILINTLLTRVPSLQFSSSSFRVDEGAGIAVVTVTRTTGVSGTATVNYATSAGTGKEGRDYTAAFGVLNFAAGESSKTFPVLIINNSYVQPARTVNLVLTNPVGATLTTPTTATLTINNNNTVNGPNPIDQPRFFVQQHYYDFLSRYPDQAGWNFWTNNITGCTPQPSCLDVQSINTSAAFFLSIEFQQTGYLVERFYKTAYGDALGTSTLGLPHQLPVPVVRLSDFLPDVQEIGKDVIVGQPGWEQKLENNKIAFAQDFVSRVRFYTTYPTTRTPAEFVDMLSARAGVALSEAERSSLINEFAEASTTTDLAARARVLRQVAENQNLYSAEFNRAFVLMQYFGYLRRNPNDPPEATVDYAGYDFWLNKLNFFNGNYIQAEMVKAFITSIEYRQRFGP